MNRIMLLMQATAWVMFIWHTVMRWMVDR